jgi:hypothetical protein
MADIVLDANIAKTIAHLLRSQPSRSPCLDAVHRALGDIVMSAVTSERAPIDMLVRADLVGRLAVSGGPQDALVDFDVHDGVVELRGVISSEETRNALCALAKRTGGVTTVHDHLIWVDPKSGAFLPSAEDSHRA